MFHSFVPVLCHNGDQLMANPAQLALIHECVDFPHFNGIPQKNVYLASGDMLVTTPDDIPIPDSWQDGYFVFDQRQSARASGLHGTYRVDEMAKPALYKCWFNPAMISAIRRDKEPIVTINRRPFYKYRFQIGKFHQNLHLAYSLFDE